MKASFFEFIYNHFIYDEQVYKYYFNHAYTFDYYNEDFYRNCIGCNMIIDKFDTLRLVVPFIPNEVDDITALINVHEYVHTLLVYDKLNMRYKKSDFEEVLPIFYEKLFIRENGSQVLKEYGEKLDSYALNNNDKYSKAIMIANKMVENYEHDNFESVNKKAKKLYKKFSSPST